MTIGLSVQRSTQSAQAFDVPGELRRLRARLRVAEDRATNLEQALVSNRRIGMAVGILMCLHQLTDDRAIELLKLESQNRNVKLRDLAETVIHTGTL